MPISPEPLPKINYSPKECAHALGISRVTLYELWKRGDGPESFTVGKRRLVPIEAAKNWRPKTRTSATVPVQGVA